MLQHEMNQKIEKVMEKQIAMIWDFNHRHEGSCSTKEHTIKINEKGTEELKKNGFKAFLTRKHSPNWKY